MMFSVATSVLVLASVASGYNINTHYEKKWACEKNFHYKGSHSSNGYTDKFCSKQYCLNKDPKNYPAQGCFYAGLTDYGKKNYKQCECWEVGKKHHVIKPKERKYKSYKKYKTYQNSVDYKPHKPEPKGDDYEWKCYSNDDYRGSHSTLGYDDNFCTNSYCLNGEGFGPAMNGAPGCWYKGITKHKKHLKQCLCYKEDGYDVDEPEYKEPEPEYKEPEPEYKEPEPDYEEPEPEYKEPEPDYEEPEPEYKEPEPDYEEPEPEYKEPEPKIYKHKPTTYKHEPKTYKHEPKPDTYAPEYDDDDDGEYELDY
eukprot:Pgem_evm1s10683